MSTVPFQSQQETQIDKMKESPHVWGDSNFSEIEEIDVDESKFFWMGTNANMTDTPQEQLENKLAIQQQIKNGILDEYGLPTGFTYDELGIPKEKQEEITASRNARQQQLGNTNISLPKSMNRYDTNVQQNEKKNYLSKFDRKLDREKTRIEQKKQEKLARANWLITQHQKEIASVKK
jgi:hypothetical protein